jgi:hypothetical protein
MTEVKRPRMKKPIWKRPRTKTYTLLRNQPTFDINDQSVGLAALLKSIRKPPQPPQQLQPTASVHPIENAIGDFILETIKSEYKRCWRETDPESYLAYQGTWLVAPYWPESLGWLLNLTALGAVVRGASRIAEKGKKRS